MDNDFATGYALGADSNGGNCNGNGNGMWGGDWIWAFLIFALFGWGNGGFGGFGGGNGVQGSLTRADLCQDMNFQGLENGVRGIQQGLCDGFYAVNTSLLNGFNGVDNAVCNLGYQNAQLINGVNNTIQQGFNAANVVALQNQNALQTQISSCCCENRQGQADIKYQMATDTCAITTAMANNTRDIIDNQNANYRGLMDWMVQRDMDNLRTENQNLKLAASQAAQNAYLVDQLRPCPVPSYTVCNPFTGAYGGYAGYGNAYNNSGCGCNSGCCGCNG